MPVSLQIIALTVFVLFFGCNHSVKNPTSKKDSTSVKALSEKIDNPRSFVKNYGVNDNNSLFVFVGHKIWVDTLPSTLSSFDNEFKAKYVVLKKVFGEFPRDTIEFMSFDHYGTPPFSKFEDVLLFVSADSGTYFHQKYLYNDVIQN
jgi:hypothetical protein